MKIKPNPMVLGYGKFVVSDICPASCMRNPIPHRTTTYEALFV